MIDAELPLIVEALRGVQPPIVDVGSSTAAFRRRPKLSYDLAELLGRDVISFDAKAGDGVDVVGDAHQLTTHFAPASVGGIICTSLLEHVCRPWSVVAEAAAVLRSGGRIVLTVPWVYPHHADPLDCWRISADGLQELGAWAGLQKIRSGYLRPSTSLAISYLVAQKVA